MAKCAFKVGDVVECVDNSGWSGITVGEHYTVQEVEDPNDGNSALLWIDGDGGGYTGVYAKRFKLAPPAPQKPSVVVGEGLGDIRVRACDAENTRAAAYSLSNAFPWSGSPEGYAFWCSIQARLDAMARDMEAAIAKREAEAKAKAEAEAKARALPEGVRVTASWARVGMVWTRASSGGESNAAYLTPAQAREFASP